MPYTYHIETDLEEFRHALLSQIGANPTSEMAYAQGNGSPLDFYGDLRGNDFVMGLGRTNTVKIRGRFEESNSETVRVIFKIEGPLFAFMRKRMALTSFKHWIEERYGDRCTFDDGEG